jgi:L-fuconate dehydratase
MAVGAVVNACWDLAARRAGKPLWLLLADLSPRELVGLVDFRYLSDALTPDEALELLERGQDGKDERAKTLSRDGYPAYSTTPGWLGYSDDTLAALCAQAVQDGFTQVKLKVGARLEDDKRRCAIARETVGEDVAIAIDANQVWDVAAAIAWIRELAPVRPAWIEEPTSPSDVLGFAAIKQAVRPLPVATGEHVANRVMFKQLLQADAIDVMQIDACRVAGVNENLANLLLAAKFGVSVCPHAGGVGLCEMVQHLSMFDYVALTGTTDGRMIEWIDHLHEHFVNPAIVTAGRYQAPSAPGFSTQIRPESLAEFSFPDGPEWRDTVQLGIGCTPGGSGTCRWASRKASTTAEPARRRVQCRATSRYAVGESMVRMVSPSVLVVCSARRLMTPTPKAERTSATSVVG